MLTSAPLRLRILIAALAIPVAAPAVAFAQATGFNQTGAGPYDYTNTANWTDGIINGIWDTGLTVTAGQVIEFSTSTVLSTGLTFREADAQSKTLRAASGGPLTLTMGGDILVNPSGNSTTTFGSTSGSQNLNVDLGGAVRTLTVFGGGNGGNFGKTLTFINNVSNGGVIASGGGSGGGKIQFNGLSISLNSAEVRDAELSFNGSGNSTANSAYTIAGALTGGGGASTVTVLAKTSATARNALVHAGSFVRNSGSTVLFRGTALGTQTIASATGGTANISFTNAPTLLGGSGAAGTSTIGIIAGAFGDTSTTGTGFGATGGLVTYDAANGVRLLSASEYTGSITDGQTTLDNVRIANSSGAIATTNLTAATTTINSLSLTVSGATGNQGITITGDEGATLKINSGVIYAEQNVTGGSSPATTDAITINAPALDLNGQEGIIHVNTRMNSGGTTVSNGALIINSTITNGTGLTIGDGMSNNASGYVILGGDSANTYTGDTTINGAIVQLNKTVANSFGDLVINLGSVYDRGNQIADTANVTINGGTLFLNSTNNSGSATSETINDLTMRNGTVSSGSGNGNTFNIDGDATLSGGTVNMPTNAKLNIAGTTTLSGGVISVGQNNHSVNQNSKATLAGAVIIENTAAGTAAYNAINIGAGSGSGNLGGQVELSGDVSFIGNANTNTVTITGATGTGQQGVLALNGVRTFDIGDGAADADLTINAPLTDGTAAGGLVKTGAGTLALFGDNTYTGPTTLSAGTLSLGAAHRLADTGQLVMNGGIFATNGFSETLGTLDLTASSIIDLGSGDSDLAFADSSAVAWGESLVLNIINFTEGVDSIRFGFNQNGLDPTQLGMIRLNGSAADIDSAGYLTYAAVPEPSTYAVFAGAASLLLALRRRRRAA